MLRCACGKPARGGGECTECRAKRLAADSSAAPPIVHSALRSPSRQLPTSTRAPLESQFGRDFSHVRVHDNPEAAASARAVNASAYTVGNRIVFGGGEFRPATRVGMQLLAHELAHVVQQEGAEASSQLRILDNGGLEAEAEQASGRVGERSSVVQRPGTGVQRDTIGTRVTQPAGVRSPFRTVDATFDGQDFVLSGDHHPILTVAGESGRPISVRAADAAACGGSTSESYKNNPRYVGIRDNGPIPEGEYQFRYEQMATFSATEQLRMTLGGHYTDPFGTPLHGGDWGSGRVALQPIRIVPGRRGCGNTATRSGFFLHGGSLPGSSGCIDIGNSGMDSVVSLLAGYRGRIVVRVHYTHPPPTVSGAERAVGRFTYPGGEDPGIIDRIWGLFGGDE